MARGLKINVEKNFLFWTQTSSKFAGGSGRALKFKIGIFFEKSSDFVQRSEENLDEFNSLENYIEEKNGK